MSSSTVWGDWRVLSSSTPDFILLILSLSLYTARHISFHSASSSQEIRLAARTACWSLMRAAELGPRAHWTHIHACMHTKKKKTLQEEERPARGEEEEWKIDEEGLKKPWMLSSGFHKGMGRVCSLKRGVFFILSSSTFYDVKMMFLCFISASFFQCVVQFFCLWTNLWSVQLSSHSLFFYPRSSVFFGVGYFLLFG